MTEKNTEHQSTIALASLVRGNLRNIWVVRRCPYCSKKHTHAAGYAHEDPRQHLGTRIAHCVTPWKYGGYTLIEKEIGEQKEQKG